MPGIGQPLDGAAVAEICVRDLHRKGRVGERRGGGGHDIGLDNVEDAWYLVRHYGCIRTFLELLLCGGAG